MSQWSIDGERPTHDILPNKPAVNGITNKREGVTQGFVKTKDAQITVNDGAVNRIVMGQRNDGTYGIKVSKVGFDALTGTNDQMIMNSDFNQFKIVGSGTASVTPPTSFPSAGQSITTIPHNLGYIPAFQGFFNGGTTGLFSAVQQTNLPYYAGLLNGTTAFLGFIGIYAYVDATNIYFEVDNRTTSTFTNIGTFNFKYYLLQETAN